ncbi:MAG: PD-(D/E)XK nuclease family protein [Thermofilum sp.]|uniref:PD-(D/E)XK nuclease family protein n=1 Tax=Thermofilum sp. TaxID=1961369 RepID=UPI0031660E72
MKKRNRGTVHAETRSQGEPFTTGTAPPGNSLLDNINYNIHTLTGEPFPEENRSQGGTVPSQGEPFSVGTTALGNSPHYNNNNYIYTGEVRGTVPDVNPAVRTVPDHVLNIFHDTIEQLRILFNESKRRKIIITELAQCLRASFYYVQYGKEITDKLLLGADKHDWTQRHMIELLGNKLKCESEYEVSWKGVRGRIDLLCRDENGDVYVIELKFSSNPTGANPFLPWYIRQLKYYTAITSIRENKDVYGILLLMAYNYETYFIKTIKITLNEVKDVVNELEQRASMLASAKSSFAPPPRERGNWCGLCTFRSVCLSEALI